MTRYPHSITDSIRKELAETKKTYVKRMQLIDVDGAEPDIVNAML